MRQDERRCVKHLTRNLHKARIAGGLEAENAIADDRMTNGREVAAYLVGAPGLDTHAQERSVSASGFASNLGDGVLSVDWRVNNLMHELKPAGSDCVVDLGDSMDTKDINGGQEGGVILGKHQATSGITIKAMDGFNGWNAFLNSKNGFDALRVVATDHTSGLVADEVMIILPKHSDMAFDLRPMNSSILGANICRRLRACALHHLGRDVNGITGLEREARYPHTLTIDPDGTSVNHRLCGAARECKLKRKKVLKNLRVRLLHDKRSHPCGMVWSLASCHSRIMLPTTPWL